MTLSARRRATRRAVTAAAVLTLVPMAGARAQDPAAARETSSASWLTGWSPLRPFGDLALPTPRVPQLPQLIELTSPRLGLSWTAGNPAGVPDEIDTAWTRLRVAAGNGSGSYHAPIDPDNVKSVGTSLMGWRRLGSRAAAIGRVAVEHETVGGAYGAFATPLPSSPFVPTDTNRPALSRPVVTLEGAEGIALGSCRGGASAGYRAAENTSGHSPAALDGRSTTTGLSVGIARVLARGWRAGAHGRWLQSSESVDLTANPADVRVYSIDGYVNVDPADYTPLTSAFLRRANRYGSAFGIGLAGDLLGATVTSFAEAQWMNESQISAVVSEHPPTDRWRTTGFAVGGAAQRSFGGVVATIDAGWRTQRGDGRPAVDSTLQFEASASRLWTAAELRYGPSDSSWCGSGSVSIERDQQVANDYLAQAGTDVTAWMPNAAVEVSRRVSRTLSISGAAGLAQYTPYATLPQPQGRGAAYGTLIAPAIEIAAATARSELASVAARFTRRGNAVSIRLWRTSTAPIVARVPLVPLPLGTRTTWGVTMSIASAQ